MPYIGTAPSGAVSHAPYFGTSPDAGNYTELTDVSGSFNSSTTQFALTSSSGGLAISPGNEAGLLISINGVIQEPTTDYTVSGTNITFTTAPDSGDTFFGVSMGSGAVDVGTPSNSTVTSAKLASTFFTGSADIGAAIADADLFMIDDGAGGTIRKTTAARIKTYVEDAAGEVPIANLNIDGGTDIGAAIVDADLFIIDDGAGGTNRKTTASRIKTYIGGDAGGFPLTALDIDGGTDIGAALADADLFIVDDGAGGTNRKSAMSRIKTYMGVGQSYMSAYISGGTGTISRGTYTTVTGYTEYVDKNGDFNNSTGIFTFPVFGDYLMIGQVGQNFDDIGDDGEKIQIRFVDGNANNYADNFYQTTGTANMRYGSISSSIMGAFAADATIKMQVLALDADGGDSKLNDAQFTVIRIK